MEINTTIMDGTVFLTFKGTEYRQIPINKIVSIQTMEKYVEIVTTYTKFYIIIPFKDVIKYLTGFIEVQKGFVINKYYISKLVKQVKDKSKYDLHMFDGVKGSWSIEVSDYVAKNILKQL